MKDRPLYLNPKTYTLSALIIGYALLGDYTANEQNAIGNWLMTISQILECNSAIQQAIEEKYKGYTFNINSRQFKNGGSPYMNNPPIFDFPDPSDQEIEDIKKVLQNMIKKLDEIKKKCDEDNKKC